MNPAVKRKVQSLFLPGPAGRLEALWEEPERARDDLLGVVCHPHPLYGGTLHNKVVHYTSMALQERGLRVLRFNFRGTGKSAGEHDRGRGEAEDVRAALDHLGEKFGEAGVVVAGFSFGAWVGLRVACEDERVRALVGVGLPTDMSDHSYLTRCCKPKLFVQGTRDEYGAETAVRQLVEQAPEPKKLIWIEKADHFFAGQLEELQAAVRDHLPIAGADDASASG
jgi:alpha/beta superfamily hydrolase